MAKELDPSDMVTIWAQLPNERAREQFLELLRLLRELHNANVRKRRFLTGNLQYLSERQRTSREQNGLPYQ